MNYLKALLDTYETCLDQNLVDNPESNIKVIPVYHTSSRSNGQDIINIVINPEGQMLSASFLLENEYTIFPITEESVSRSGKYPPPHPLVDKFKYINVTDNTKLNELYLEEISAWLEYSKDRTNIPILEAVYKFVNKGDIYKPLIAELFDIDKVEFLEGHEFNIIDIDKNGKVKKKLFNLDAILITFTLVDGDSTISINDDKNTHDQYINYVRDIKSNENKQYCNISSNLAYCSNKHRGVIGTARMISGSNNTETYLGRFKKSTDAFNAGYEVSQKVHLMLKALIDNKNSYKFLGEDQHMVVWFSDDIANESKLEVDDPYNLFEKFYEKEPSPPIIGEGAQITKNISYGISLADPQASFYILIFEKTSPGRVAIKYFRELPKSELIARLEKWVERHSWYSFNWNTRKFEYLSPDIYKIINAAYGIERDGKLIIPNRKFRKALIQNMLQSILESRTMPSGIRKAVEKNIRNRIKYKNTWKNIYYTSLQILRDNIQGGVEEVLDTMRDSRSFLFGKLLAVYEGIEKATYAGNNVKENETRITNAEKYWNAFTTNPERVMHTLQNSIMPYLKKLKKEKPGLYVNFNKELENIHAEIRDNDFFKDQTNQQLDYRFIYGYYEQTNKNYLKKEVVKDDNNK